MSAAVNIFLLSLIAGLGTGIGGLLAIIRAPGKRSFGFLMGIAAGVMITLSFLELVNEAWELSGWATATIGFSAGAFFMFLADFFIPHIRFSEREGNEPIHQKKTAPKSHEISQDKPWRWNARPYRAELHQAKRLHRVRRRNNIHNPKLLKTGILIAFGITIHNIPEGIAVGAGFMHAPRFGFFIALAILLHNIPEGIATALPYAAAGFVNETPSWPHCSLEWQNHSVRWRRLSS